MTKDEALDLALEALIDASGHVNNETFVKVMMARDAINDAIKQARSAPVQKPYRPLQDNGSQYFGDSWDTLPAQPAPVQEPDLIARLKHPEDHYEFTDPKKANAVLMSLCQEAADALSAPVQEPVAKDNSNYRLDPPEAEPAQRQWVGLTDDERLEVAEIDGADEWFWKVCKAIEAKLKEKNNART
jgi:hypothetical protein